MLSAVRTLTNASSGKVHRAFASPRTSNSRSACVRVKAELNTPTPGKALQNIASAVDAFTKRYDVLSTGIGALTVTSYCVYVKGQDPWTALSITFTATVFALVVNEVCFSSNNNSSSKH